MPLVVGIAAKFSAAFLTSVSAYEAVWSTTGEHEQIAAIDCRDCEEQLGLIIACTGNGQPARMTINGAATERGRDGEHLPITFIIDGTRFSAVAKTVEYGLIGFTPELTVAYDDPLISALQAGNIAVVLFGGGRSEYGLKGSRAALETFKTHCGWNNVGFRQNMERRQVDAGASLSLDPTGPAITKLAEAITVHGVEPGQAHTPPNQDGELWFTKAYPIVGGVARALFYGIPETDAMVVAARCESSALSFQLSLFLPVPPSSINGQAASVRFEFDGSTITHPGTVTLTNEETTGVEMELSRQDDVWSALSSSKTITLRIADAQAVTVPGAANVASFFVDECARLASPHGLNADNK